MEDPQKKTVALQKALLPEVLDIKDVAALVLRTTPSGARRAVLRGDLGAFSRVGRRILVRRESLLAALAAQEIEPEPSGPPPVPDPPQWARQLLQRGKRRGKTAEEARRKRGGR